MKTKVYVLAYSSWEDYHIHGIYSSKEKAEARKKEFLNEYRWDDRLVIDEFEIDVDKVKTAKEAIHTYYDEVAEAEKATKEFIERGPQS